MKPVLTCSSLRVFSPLALALVLAGCSGLTTTGPAAVADITPTTVASSSGMSPRGQVRFVQMADGVRMTGQVSGLKPGQEHGFHLHEAGDCTGDGTAAKGHFNPQGASHGKHGSHAHHAGDLPSLKANAMGVAEVAVTLHQLTVSAGPNSVVGKGLIVHRDPDDFTTQPTGNSGPRPGCAVIRAE